MPSPTPSAPDAKALLFVAGTLIVALHAGVDPVAATIRLTATFKDHTRQYTHIRYYTRQTAECYFGALDTPKAYVWWR